MDLFEDERFRTTTNRVKNRQIIVPLLINVLQQRTTAEWLEAFHGKGYARDLLFLGTQSLRDKCGFPAFQLERKCRASR